MMAIWMENDAQWYEQRTVFCDLCGRMIAKRYLRVEEDGEPRNFCSPECEQLYRDYWLVERLGREPGQDLGALYDGLMAQ